MANDFDKLPGLKEKELVSLGHCAVCGKPQLGPGITFYKVTISRAGFDRNALQRRVGLQMVLGGSGALAQAMGPDDPLARIFDGPHDVFVHEDCAHEIGSLLLLITSDENAVGDRESHPASSERA